MRVRGLLAVLLLAGCGGSSTSIVAVDDADGAEATSPDLQPDGPPETAGIDGMTVDADDCGVVDETDASIDSHFPDSFDALPALHDAGEYAVTDTSDATEVSL